LELFAEIRREMKKNELSGGWRDPRIGGGKERKPGQARVVYVGPKEQHRTENAARGDPRRGPEKTLQNPDPIRAVRKGLGV